MLPSTCTYSLYLWLFSTSWYHHHSHCLLSLLIINPSLYRLITFNLHCTVITTTTSLSLSLWIPLGQVSVPPSVYALIAPLCYASFSFMSYVSQLTFWDLLIYCLTFFILINGYVFIFMGDILSRSRSYILWLWTSLLVSQYLLTCFTEKTSSVYMHIVQGKEKTRKSNIHWNGTLIQVVELKVIFDLLGIDSLVFCRSVPIQENGSLINRSLIAIHVSIVSTFQFQLSLHPFLSDLILMYLLRPSLELSLLLWASYAAFIIILSFFPFLLVLKFLDELIKIWNSLTSDAYCASGLLWFL